MHLKVALSLAVLLCPVSMAVAQGAAPVAPAQPLTAMPYSPSLDPASMDRTIDPCVDFYKYSCGGWMKNNPIPPDQAKWDVYAKLANENQQFLWGILEQDAKPAAKRNAVQQKIGDYFEACMNTAAIDAAGITPLKRVLAELAPSSIPLTPQQLRQPEGARPIRTREWFLTNLPVFMTQYSANLFFGTGVGQDAVDSSLEIVELRAGGLSLPDRDYYTKTDAKSVQIREQYKAYIVQMMQLAGETEAQAKADADATLQVETALAKASLTRVERRDPHNTYHPTTYAELQQMLPSLNWNLYITMAGAPHGSDAVNRLMAVGPDGKAGAKLNVSEPRFLAAVKSELANEDVETLKSYVRFHLVNSAAPTLAEPFRKANFDFFSKTLRGIQQEPPRWKTCVRAVDRNLGEALGQEFVARTFTPEMKAKTVLMTKQIEDEMEVEIKNLDWMSPATKEEALRKLHAIRNKVGYPDKWRDYSALTVKRDDYFGNTRRSAEFERAYNWNKLGKPVDLNEWGMTPPTVNAYFNPQMNDINFPAGVLQPPLYDFKEDDAPNYGDTGSTIGHELTHAFDDEGRQFDAKGNLRDWWTADDAKKFEDRINCVRDQYAGYVVVDDVHIQSKLTSGEDVADLGGTLLAYMAWKKQTEGMKLENKDGLTPDQRYFVGMAQWACENDRPENLRVSAQTDPHSPDWARVNGVVVNMPEFQHAFSCKKDAPMVHTPACKVW